MENLMICDDNSKTQKFKKFMEQFFYKLYFGIFPYLLFPSMTILLDKFAFKLYERTLEKLLINDSFIYKK